MYGHVCETGGKREVLPPRPLKRFTFKDLSESQESQDRLREPLILKRLRQTRTKETEPRKSVLQGDIRGARLCCGLVLLYVDVRRRISLIQVKDRAH